MSSTTVVEQHTGVKSARYTIALRRACSSEQLFCLEVVWEALRQAVQAEAAAAVQHGYAWHGAAGRQPLGGLPCRQTIHRVEQNAAVPARNLAHALVCLRDCVLPAPPPSWDACVSLSVLPSTQGHQTLVSREHGAAIRRHAPTETRTLPKAMAGHRHTRGKGRAPQRMWQPPLAAPAQSDVGVPAHANPAQAQELCLA